MTRETEEDLRAHIRFLESTLRNIGAKLRQAEVLQLLTEGLSSKEIAQRLTSRPRTVETHRHNLIKKLEIYTLPGLVKYAIRKKIISADD